MSEDELSGETATRTATRRGRVAPLVAVAIAAVFALLFVVFAQASSDDAESADTPLMGRPAPQTRGALDDGAAFDLARRKGSWVVLNFFDSTCVPCVQEHPELVAFDEAQQARGNAGAELVTVVWGEQPDGAREFFDENGGEWPVVFDDGSIATAYGVAQVPETWIIDPDGFVVQHYIGKVTASGLNAQIDALRGGAA